MNDLLVDTLRYPVITVGNKKGGVGKTSVSVSLAGQAAAAGWRTLLIDLDPQGNCSRDLGYHGTELDDDGQSLFESLVAPSRAPLRPLLNVRENLDVVPGGAAVEGAEELATSWIKQGKQPDAMLSVALAPILDNYNLVVIDTPPMSTFLQRTALVASRFVLLTTKSDHASLDGLSAVAKLFATVRPVNPALELLGVVLFGVNPSATRVLRTLRQEIGEGLGDPNAVFNATIRHVEAPASDARRRGMLIHEYHEAASNAPKFYQPGGRDHGFVKADGLAGDYAELSREILQRLSERLQADAEINLQDGTMTGALAR